MEKTLRAVPEGGAVIALTHNPALLPRIPDRVVLTLAGHTHGGQVRMPVNFRLLPAEYRLPYASGYSCVGHKSLFVSPGIGTGAVPLRLGVPPEISILDITAG